MSKLVYVCFRDPSRCNADLERKLETIAQRITPDNITPRPPKIVINGNIGYCITNPASSIEENGKSVLLGMAYGDHDDWWKPGGPVPDGSYSIFRSDDENTEIVTDVVGSRSIWYYHDDEVFIASSSQRAIVMVLGNFEFNKDVIPWILSTGSLGPYLSWDKRIRLLASDSALTLNHKAWDLHSYTNKVIFKALEIPEEELGIRLMHSLKQIFKSINIDFSKWVLPLSGGYDSRGILSLFSLKGVSLSKIRAVTWGLKSSLTQRGNDAYIARKLADHFNIEHKYYLTDVSEEPIINVFNRFLICGEGRVDHIGGYMDGFKIWKTLYEDQIEGIIRGDEGFGRLPVHSPSFVRSHVEVSMCSDFANLKDFEELGIAGQKFPDNLERQKDETLDTWRDRLYHQYRMPMVLAGLSDLKLAFVELINPFLSRTLVYQARSIPDYLRTDKFLFKKVINSLSPKIAYATSGANPDATFILKSRPVVEVIKTELKSENCKKIIPATFIKYLTENLIISESVVNRKQIIKAFLKRFLPKSLIKKASNLTAGKSISVNTLAFRIFIISKMNTILQDDSVVISVSNEVKNG